MIRDAERHADDLAKDRERAIEYYRGEMNDTPADTARSSMATRDVRAQVKKVLPSIMRTLLGSDRLVEYMPVSEGDDEGAEQATDYVNLVVALETDLGRQIEEAIHDALLLRNGILTWYWEEKTCATVSQHSGLLEDAMLDLVSDEDAEVLEHSESIESMEIETPEGPVTEMVPLHDVTIKRLVTDRNIRVDAVPREQFLIHSDAVTIDDATVCGRKVTLTRSDLVAMGYDRAVIDGLSVASEDDDDDIRRDEISHDANEPHRQNEPIDYYDVFVRFDADDDGIAELHHMCFAGGLGEKNLLMDDYAEEVQYCDIKVMSQPHQWEGISLADDLMDIQRAKTVLLRETLDNIYWQNKPQPIVDISAVSNPESVLNPEFGLPIRLNDGADARRAISYSPVPFVAQQSFGMLSYLDEEATDRTGVSDASSGLAPDALQNMTAKASAMIEQAGIGQAELMVQTAAGGLRRLFRGILRLVVKHQDVERTVRLRGEWVQFDPRQWNSEMDCQVNVGLGAGTRERDMMMMQAVMSMQEKFLASLGAENNPFVSEENVWNALSRFVETSGLKTPTMYFTEPSPERIDAYKQGMAQKTSPEQMKMQAEAQAEAAKLQIEAKKAEQEFAIRQMELQINAELDAARNQVELQKARNEEMLIALKTQQHQWAMQKEGAELTRSWAEFDLDSNRLELDAANAEAQNRVKAEEVATKQWQSEIDAAMKLREAAIEENQRRPVRLGE